MLSEKDQDTLVVKHPDRAEITARPCFEICLFYDEPRSALGKGLASVIDIFAQRSAGRFAWYKTNTMKAFSRAADPAAVMMKALTEGPDFSKPGDVGIQFHSGVTGDAPEAPSIAFFSEDTSDGGKKHVRRTFVRLCLPASGTAKGRELFETAAACAAAQPVYCGHAGYSWYWSVGDTRMERAMGQHRGFLLQHPAMGYHDPFTFQIFVGRGLIQVGWLTFVGTKLLDKLGGLQSLTFESATGVGVSTLGEGKGCVLLAGAEPVIGSRDPNRAAELQPYREVGRRLSPLRLDDSAAELLDLAGFDDEDETREWYVRFFGEGSE
jgi:hypothetical protein